MSLPRGRVVVLLNPGARGLAQAGPGRIQARVAEAFAATGLGAAIETCPGEAIEEASRQAAAAGAAAVVAGGGDGTVSAAAGGLVGGSVPLGILPLGTLNHFARDLGIAGDLRQAAGIVAAGHVRSLDVGEVNGRVFLNNSSIGLYPEVVGGREQLRRRAGVGKWLAMLLAAAAVLHRFPLLTVTVQAGPQRATMRTPFVFVGNNAYQLDLLALGRRQSLERGQLSVYLATHQTRLGVVRLALRTAVGRLSQDRDFRTLLVPAIDIAGGRRTLRVAADGEVRRTPLPIRYRVRPASLRVLGPPP